MICFVIYLVISFSYMFRVFFFLMIRRPPRSTLERSSAASDVYKRQGLGLEGSFGGFEGEAAATCGNWRRAIEGGGATGLSLIHISEPTRPY